MMAAQEEEEKAEKDKDKAKENQANAPRAQEGDAAMDGVVDEGKADEETVCAKEVSMLEYLRSQKADPLVIKAQEGRVSKLPKPKQLKPSQEVWDAAKFSVSVHSTSMHE